MTLLSGPPDAKTRKYDRQLRFVVFCPSLWDYLPLLFQSDLLMWYASLYRLWAATGQVALEGARLLAIGATATSTSILKNLILPGIGHFTILDPSTTTPEDVGNNFFLEVDSIGKQRAVEAARLLSELNDSVQNAAEIAVCVRRRDCNCTYMINASGHRRHPAEETRMDRQLHSCHSPQLASEGRRQIGCIPLVG